MKVYLIRHGETVDNVAGLYAGVRDSALTIHGVEQARRLGEHFVKTDVKLTHIFASPLSRARKTAEALQKAQSGKSQDEAVGIVQVPDLIEQDFGFYEGKPFFMRSEAKKSGKETHHEKHKNDPGFVDVESKEAMCKRADAFLDQHLMQLFEHERADSELAVAVVSHGILLSNLWRRLLLRLPRKSLSIAAEVTAAKGPVVLEHLGGWSNTGYLELAFKKDDKDLPVVPITAASTSDAQEDEAPTLPTPALPVIVPDDAPDEASSSAAQKDVSAPVSPKAALPRFLAGWSTAIIAVDSKAHLVGLKRQRGGIGRLAHDEGQKKIEGFFKRQKKG
ncbi:hypothetical protein LTR56_006318 [Elasticomyces elasticus]|nr:hypothetical protein LTR56_006318 [Elasticomyces elasticus]KAK3663366.1 hypothetical protein LTR22_005773 [Elasticomyces elasticus]KAK4925445.1 hypothetical protein LTR49_007509 [Elasticomyces elasticus]KAK5764540.1 hypothetical protein LTS12_005270 [Elasticomyces elasticus]